MNSTIERVHRAIVAAAFALLLSTPSLPALGKDNRIVVPQISPGEYQNLQSRQQRLEFQQRQQINRELDSLSNRQRQPRIEVPVFKPSCSPGQVGVSC